MDDDNQVQEAEIVEETGVQESSGQSQVMILQSLESLIRENLDKIDKLVIESNQHNEMINSVLENDEVYKQHLEAVQAAQKIKNGTKNEILKRTDVSHIVEKLKDVKLEIKEIKESMNSYLQEYQRLSGSNEIEDNSGKVMQIVSVAKLVKRRV